MANYTDAPQAEHSRDLSTVAGNIIELRTQIDRVLERSEWLTNLANHVGGAEPTQAIPNGPAGKLTPVAGCLVDELREETQRLERRLNQIAHDSGRLERAIRG